MATDSREDGKFLSRKMMVRCGGHCNENHNSVVQPLLTDLYQITMAYAYWKSGKTEDQSVFDLFFRANPFQGEFTIFAGLEECLKFLENFHYSDGDIEYLKQTLPDGIEDEFFEYLSQLTAKDVILQAIEEGSVVFPRVPLIKVEGPLIVVQLLETTLLTLVNYASLMATNAARYRMVAGKNIKLLEFGLRRAQGPDGGLSASKYSFVGGFDGTSNVLAGKLFNIPVKGTHAHAYITSFTGFSELKTRTIRHKVTGIPQDLLELSIKHRDALSEVLDISTEESSEGELAAMVSFAIAFPDGFMALVDTYDVKSVENGVDLRHPVNGEMNGHSGGTSDINSNITLPNVAIECNHKTDVRPKLTCNADVECKCRQRSGGWSYGVLEDRGCSRCCSSMRNSRKILVGHVVLGRNRTNLLTNVGKSFRSGLLNFCAVALALNDQGYRAIGIRIDSGDLAYLSCLARQTFEQVSARFRIPWFNTLTIVASNDINEDTIISLNEQGHKIDCFGIGTHLVTCQRQPALGCVYKLVEINNQARIKLSQDVEKVTMPGSKNAFRLFGADGHALIDLMQKVSEPPPEVGQKVLCRHPFQESKRAYVIPTRVECLYKVYWRDGRICQPLPTLDQVRDRVQASLKTVRTDHKRTLNPTPYKVAVSDHLYNFIHDLWLQNAPIGELS
ncbi:nicotinate phosphoribosyltransferase isoform X1 [Phlebotomus papatasi]|uniref:nicotinate phosphoribosyltransferase isoform X1 n=1 Tax=Phlebotomus papatasi TaxID=29031 RepID=UPI0024845920|nr:nicotinate phosphoribosyltransferase isoform X1 [Phlebotomus papatasi]